MAAFRYHHAHHNLSRVFTAFLIFFYGDTKKVLLLSRLFSTFVQLAFSFVPKAVSTAFARGVSRINARSSQQRTQVRTTFCFFRMTLISRTLLLSNGCFFPLESHRRSIYCPCRFFSRDLNLVTYARPSIARFFFVFGGRPPARVFYAVFWPHSMSARGPVAAYIVRNIGVNLTNIFLYRSITKISVNTLI